MRLGALSKAFIYSILRAGLFSGLFCIFTTTLAQAQELFPDLKPTKPKIKSGFSVTVRNNHFVQVSAQPLPLSKRARAEIVVDPREPEHEIWGFGGNITESCLSNLDLLNSQQRRTAMEALFSPKKGAGLNYIRIPIGANDYSSGDYTLNDTPDNEPDPEFRHMSFKKLDPLLAFVKEARQYNPNIKVMMTPWTPPAWMKVPRKLRGGYLAREHFPSYANYLARTASYIRNQGLNLHSLSILNEPLIDAWQDWHYPQGAIGFIDQVDFIKHHLEPKMRTLGLEQKILAHDHNWDNATETDRALQQDQHFRSSVQGIAYHCYGGDYDDLVRSRRLNPDIPAMNTECTATMNNNSTSSDFQWWLHTQSVDAIYEGVSGALGWNLCLDEQGGPRNNGCKNCRGLITINTKKLHSKDRFMTRNSEYYALAQTSRYVADGARKISSSQIEDIRGLSHVAIQNPDRSLVVVIRNAGSLSRTVQITRAEGGYALGVVKVPAHGASTYLIK